MKTINTSIQDESRAVARKPSDAAAAAALSELNFTISDIHYSRP